MMKKYIFFNLIYIFCLFLMYHYFFFKSDHTLVEGARGKYFLGGATAPRCPPPIYGTDDVNIVSQFEFKQIL